MIRILNRLLLVSFLSFVMSLPLYSPGPSYAQDITIPGPMQDRPVTITHTTGTAFTAVDVTGTVTTDAIYVRGYRFLTLEIDYTHTDATAVTMTCAQRETTIGTFRDIQVLTYAGSTASSDTHTWSKAVSGNTQWVWTVKLRGYYQMKCTFDSDGTSDNDLTVVGKVGI